MEKAKKFINKETGAIYTVDSLACLDYFLTNSEYEEYAEESKKTAKKSNKKAVDNADNVEATVEESNSSTEEN